MAKCQESDLSDRSKKSDILNAYNKLLKDMKDKKTVTPQEEKQKREEVRIVGETKELSQETIIKKLGDVKIHIIKALELLEENISEQYRRFTNLCAAIKVEEENLKEIYDIHVEADALAALLASQKQQREDFDLKIKEEKTEFEDEMERQREEWEEEEKKREIEKKEYEAKLKKQREREEEEYSYNTVKKRKFEEDKYQAERTSLLKDLEDKKKEVAEREEIIAGKEGEYNSFKTEVENFPSKLAVSVEEAKKQLYKDLTKDHEFKILLLKKESEADKKLYEQKVISLENKIAEQQKFIENITQKFNEAGRQVENIAIKAVEGAFPRDSKQQECVSKS
jgi:hypothetical protein